MIAYSKIVEDDRPALLNQLLATVSFASAKARTDIVASFMMDAQAERSIYEVSSPDRKVDFENLRI